MSGQKNEMRRESDVSNHKETKADLRVDFHKDIVPVYLITRSEDLEKEMSLMYLITNR